jgi:hypothetical protein
MWASLNRWYLRRRIGRLGGLLKHGDLRGAVPRLAQSFLVLIGHEDRAGDDHGGHHCLGQTHGATPHAWTGGLLRHGWWRQIDGRRRHRQARHRQWIASSSAPA